MLRPAPKPNFKRRKPLRRNRNNFSKKIRNEIYNEANGVCQQCGGRGEEIHHVMPRSRNGRGVKTNGLLVCHKCHRDIHDNPSLLVEWIRVYKSYYGDYFWHDEFDKE